MANISLQSIITLLQQAALEAFNGRNDPSKWEGSIQDGTAQRPITVSEVSMEATAFAFEIEDGETKIGLTASPALSSIGRLRVSVNGEPDPDAAVVYKPVPSLGNPARFHLDFKRVSVSSTNAEGEKETDDVRINLAYPKGG